MSSIISYHTPSDFLQVTEAFLQKKALENNMILGFCNNFEDKTKPQEGVFFVTVMEKGKLQIASMVFHSRLLIAAKSLLENAIATLADYYIKHEIEIKTIIAEKEFTEAFAHYYPKIIVEKIPLLLNKLTIVQPLPLVEGDFLMADDSQIELFTDWTIAFEMEIHVNLPPDRDKMRKLTESRIKKGTIFQWVVAGEIVCMVAIMRRTPEVGIVGLVYTPPDLRGKGYATSATQKLSEWMLQNGYETCVLFTEKANRISNHIYQKIGYEPISEFLEIGY